MNGSQATVIAVSNQKGGTAKTTTAVHLAHAFALGGHKTLLIDMDPQGNASQALGFQHGDHGASIADLLWDRTLPTERAIYPRGNLHVIVANPNLAKVERGLATLTNAELRLAQRLRELRPLYDLIVLDSAPSFGILLNSVLNAADALVVPVDCNVFALHGLQSLLGEIEEIKLGTNPSLKILGYLMTMVDRTIISQQTTDAVAQNFGETAFKTRIRRAVAIREAAALGRTVFEHDPASAGAADYWQLALEVTTRLASLKESHGLRLVTPAASVAEVGGAL